MCKKRMELFWLVCFGMRGLYGGCLCYSAFCHCEKYLKKINIELERFILLHSSRCFRMSLAGSKAEGCGKGKLLSPLSVMKSRKADKIQSPLVYLHRPTPSTRFHILQFLPLPQSSLRLSIHQWTNPLIRLVPLWYNYFQKKPTTEHCCIGKQAFNI